LREEYRLRVFENRVLRKIFRSNKDEVTGEWRRLHNEQLHEMLLTKYYSSDQIKKNEMGKACGTHGRQGRCTQGFRWET
jgi:hypothetical protein